MFISTKATPMKAMILSIKILLAQVFLLQFSACDFAPGSYPYAETYELNYSEEEVKIAIRKFKSENPEYVVPKVTIDGTKSWELIDEQSKSPGYWYLVYFYYPEDNQIVFTWTRPRGKGKTTFAFVSINEGLTLGNWKDINKDYHYTENAKVKKKFEDRILNQIKRNF